jgi:hypothetical protein
MRNSQQPSNRSVARIYVMKSVKLEDQPTFYETS